MKRFIIIFFLLLLQDCQFLFLQDVQLIKNFKLQYLFVLNLNILKIINIKLKITWKLIIAILIRIWLILIIDVGVPSSGGRRKRWHAHCHGEFSKEEHGDRKEPCYSSSTGHFVIAGKFIII